MSFHLSLLEWMKLLSRPISVSHTSELIFRFDSFRETGITFGNSTSEGECSLPFSRALIPPGLRRERRGIANVPAMNLSSNRPGGMPRRLLGDARRETAEALHVAASKRRRLDALPEGGADDGDDDDDPRVASALADDEVGMFAGVDYDADDVEADAIYAAVDARMASRRQKHREARLQQDLADYRKKNPTIRQQFADLKNGLADVSTEEWAAIPDIGDYSVKKHKWDKYTPAPDSLLERAKQETAYVTSEPANYGTATDLASIGAGRSSVLGQKLDRAGDSLPGQTTVDATGYLNELAGERVSTESEIGDIIKARLLLKSVTSTNPMHAPGWIAAARLEETAGKLSAARQLILEGCRKCPRQEDVWVEATRLHQRQVGRRILAQAVKTVPKSEKVWLQASTLEDEVNSKRRVLLKGLELIPSSVRLWKAAVELEDPTGARILLSRAVECAPQATNLWLALARLQPYESAKRTLRKAQDTIRTDPTICITAAQLDETQNGLASPEIQVVLQNGVNVLSITSNAVKREDWLKLAEESDRAGYPGTVKAIVESSIDLGIDDADREKVWTADAQAMENKKFKDVSRAIYARLSRTFPSRTDLWQSYAAFERRNEDRSRVQGVLEEAVGYCPQAETLWLMLAKDKWKTNGADAAREVISRAFEANPDSQAVWLAAAKVETESGEYEKARSILRRARAQAPSAKVYMKSALLERQLSNWSKEKELLETGLDKYPKAEKLWLMLAQWHERASSSTEMDIDRIERRASETMEISKLSNPRSVYALAVDKCGKCADLWVGYARFEERCGSISKARAILERGREKCKGSEKMDVLWRECVYLEVRDSKRNAANSILARSLQECKHSGRLWALSVALETRPGQKAKSVDAIKHCPDDGVVILEVAKYIWRTGKLEKARTWLKRSAEVDPDWGDSWATWLAFEREHGDDDAVAKVENLATDAEPKHGDIWVTVSKKVGNESLTSKDILHKTAALADKVSNVTGIFDTSQTRGK